MLPNFRNNNFQITSVHVYILVAFERLVGPKDGKGTRVSRRSCNSVGRNARDTTPGSDRDGHKVVRRTYFHSSAEWRRGSDKLLGDSLCGPGGLPPSFGRNVTRPRREHVVDYDVWSPSVRPRPVRRPGVVSCT